MKKQKTENANLIEFPMSRRVEDDVYGGDCAFDELEKVDQLLRMIDLSIDTLKTKRRVVLVIYRRA